MYVWSTEGIEGGGLGAIDKQRGEEGTHVWLFVLHGGRQEAARHGSSRLRSRGRRVAIGRVGAKREMECCSV